MPRPSRPALRGLLAVLPLLVAASVLVPAQPALAAPAATGLTVSAPTEGVVDSLVPVRAALIRTETGEPVPGAPVRLERRVDGVWSTVVPGTTDDRGTVTGRLPVLPQAADNTFRAVYDGTPELAAATSEPVLVLPRRRTTVLTLSGPGRVVDETSARLQLRWRAGNGAPVPGRAVVQVRSGSDGWRRHTGVTLGPEGTATVSVAPRTDTRWRAVGAAGRWWEGATSTVHVLDNVPPVAPVRYPTAAPQPRVSLPPQPHAVGAGPNARVGRLGDRVWRSMVGRSWHRGCPVGRAALRLVQVNYWGYDGYRYRGEIVVNASIAGKTARLFGALYRNRMPLRAMYRVDRFGWSEQLQGADDYRSMAAGNTSAFNCRNVVGRPGVRSPHTYGRAIDINPWENPYRASHGWVPNQWWVGRSHTRIAWRSRSHPMVRIMRAQGFRWSYGTGDAHHFDG